MLLSHFYGVMVAGGVVKMKIEDLMCGKVIAVVVFIAVTITEIYLSHQNGSDFGAASRSLSTRIHH